MEEQTLFVSYNDQLHKSHVIKNIPKDITIGEKWSDHLTFSGFSESLLAHWDGEKLQIDRKDLHTNEHLILDDRTQLHFFLTDQKESHYLDIAGKNTFTVGGEKYDDIELSGVTATFALTKEDEKTYFLDVFKGNVFHNFSKIKGSTKVSTGDELFFDGVTLVVQQETIILYPSGKEVRSRLVSLNEADQPYGEEYPDYHRSPRIIYREPDDRRTIARPSRKPAKPSEQLGRTIIPPLVMIIALIIVSLIQPRGIFIIVMFVMTITTVVVSVVYYIKNVRQYKREMKQRKLSYEAYLKRKTKELYQAAEEQRHALHYHYPDITKIRDMAIKIDARIYEKTIYHHDFLHYRTGLGNIETSFEIDFNIEEFTLEKDELMDQAKNLYDDYQEVADVPIVAKLTAGPVGYIGNRRLVLEQLQLMVMQLALFHSYRDLQFITVFPEEEKEEWNWMRWLPHATLSEVNVRGFVYHERSRDQVLNSLYQILKERKNHADEKENNEKMHFSPHYVVLITDEKLLLDHTIMEFFNENPEEIGVSLVFVQDVMQSLPEHVTNVIDIRDAKNGNIILEEGELVNKKFTPDHFPEPFHKEDIPRALAPLNHVEGLKNTIPENVSFLEMYGVEKVEELGIEERWNRNETYKTLAVPLGLRGKEDIVQLNLHEKAHGPHGLIAGTTGSGKSEIIQSYILSLAVNFHPHEVAFLLIDYKGGGMANLFKNLPHLLGTITNLDKAQSMRALASIKAELQKRQRLFAEHDVNHINQYQKLYKQGKAKEAMPHLFLISDEFAELKAEQPDFMKELVSTARIGRSLGIHLILATQKPSGVVDDQIWSNSKFKLALKVQNESDSKEVLKTPDAAEITLPGRAYLQVGNNEIYELFQSAYSGADYVPYKDDENYVDTTIYSINELGQYDILTEDLSGLDKKEKIEKIPTELEAIIDYIHGYSEAQQIEPLPRPWLPPLKEKIYQDEIQPIDFKEAWEEPKKPLQVTIGMLDQPELQSQTPLSLDLTKDGHVVVFASPGYGKSTFLQTTVMNLAMQHHPGHLHVYLLDFGTNGLLPLRNLPHVADTIMIDETEKVGKLLRILTDEIKERKKRLSKHGVANMEMYEQASGETVPNILLVMDNYDAVREAEFVDEFNKIMTQIAREGAGIGIHLAISAGGQNALRVPLQSNLKLQAALYLIEETEVRSIVGRTDLEPAEIPGRGMIKLDEPVLFQTLLPVQGEEPLERMDEMIRIAEEMEQYWDGELPDAIPMMPEGVLEFETFKNNRKTKELVKKEWLPLGLDFEEVLPVAFQPEAHRHLTVVSDRKDGLERMHRALAKNMTLLPDSYQTMIIDASEQNLSAFGNHVNAYLSDQSSMTAIKKDLLKEIEMRKETQQLSNKWMILITDLKDFAERSDLQEEEFARLLDDGPPSGIHLIICSDYQYIGIGFEQIPKYARNQATVGLVSMRLGDQDIFKQPYIRQEKYPDVYEVYFAMDHDHLKIKIPD